MVFFFKGDKEFDDPIKRHAAYGSFLGAAVGAGIACLWFFLLANPFTVLPTLFVTVCMVISFALTIATAAKIGETVGKYSGAMETIHQAKENLDTDPIVSGCTVSFMNTAPSNYAGLLYRYIFIKNPAWFDGSEELPYNVYYINVAGIPEPVNITDIVDFNRNIRAFVNTSDRSSGAPIRLSVEQTQTLGLNMHPQSARYSNCFKSSTQLLMTVFSDSGLPSKADTINGSIVFDDTLSLQEKTSLAKDLTRSVKVCHVLEKSHDDGLHDPASIVNGYDTGLSLFCN